MGISVLLIQHRFGSPQRLLFEIAMTSSAHIISIALLPGLLSKVEGSDCEGFRAAACPLTESNILGFDNKQDLASCQRQCQLNSNCNWFTSYADQCWQLTDCSYLEICPECVSGPRSPPIFEECPWPPKPQPDPTTTSTTTTTTTSQDCDVFHREESCDLDELNILEKLHDVRKGPCQDMCRANSQCNFFTWYPTSGLTGNCWLLEHCDSWEVCQGCISGPAVGSDVDFCSQTLQS